MYSHLYPARTDIPKATSADIYYTSTLMEQVDAMLLIDKQQKLQRMKYESMNIHQFIREKKLILPNDMQNAIPKEMLTDNDKLLQEGSENNEEIQEIEESSNLIGQKGSDDESSQNDDEGDDL
ncbi:Hypothetical_protein [Hexamita inflata]|uniref:Hypothetical_protein n=1 Tax=Hexamita inflata TaxID=28002 RepID=A0AA86NKQ9_9EUKA|nr:Hypothetical protein HINF_LOCUS9399 [Hexamita inflata]CAI9975054.1 Hypothetical protein HINF_LOCUS62699 [Hexamita inflata]